MPKFLIDSDEWYPVFYLETLPEKLYKYHKTIELTDSELTHINKVFEEFEKVQQRLRKLSWGEL